MQNKDNPRYLMTMITAPESNPSYPLGVAIWMMDDEIEEAQHCVTATFPEWWTYQDRVDEIERLENIYGVK